MYISPGPIGFGSFGASIVVINQQPSIHSGPARNLRPLLEFFIARTAVSTITVDSIGKIARTINLSHNGGLVIVLATHPPVTVAILASKAAAHVFPSSTRFRSTVQN